MLPVDKLVPTPDNKRGPVSKTSVQSLGKSMLEDGVLHPIVVRPHPTLPNHWEIRAGERRWHAAKAVGITHLPAVIRKLDDEAALSVTVAENLQREALHPLKEAATIQQALEREYDIKAVPARLGKRPKDIARRASLTRLSKSWRDEVLRPNSEASRLSVAHLELVARLPQETQDLLAEDDFALMFQRGFPTVDDLRRVIDKGLHSLHAMPWRLDDETLEPRAGSCLNCPKRSGVHPLLFESEDAEKNGKLSKTDRCLDPSCFNRKHTAHVLRCEVEARKDHPNLRLVQIGYSGLNTAAQEAFGDRVTRMYDIRITKPSKPGAVAVMQVDGLKAGVVMHADFGDAESLAINSGRAKRNGEAAGKPLSLEERKARLQKRRDAFFVNRVVEKLKAFTPEGFTELVNDLKSRNDEEAKRFDSWRSSWPLGPICGPTANMMRAPGPAIALCEKAMRQTRRSRPSHRWWRFGSGAFPAQILTPSQNRHRMQGGCVRCWGSFPQRLIPQPSRRFRRPVMEILGSYRWHRHAATAARYSVAEGDKSPSRRHHNTVEQLARRKWRGERTDVHELP